MCCRRNGACAGPVSRSIHAYRRSVRAWHPSSAHARFPALTFHGEAEALWFDLPIWVLEAWVLGASRGNVPTLDDEMSAIAQESPESRSVRCGAVITRLRRRRKVQPAGKRVTKRAKN